MLHVSMQTPVSKEKETQRNRSENNITPNTVPKLFEANKPEVDSPNDQAQMSTSTPLNKQLFTRNSRNDFRNLVGKAVGNSLPKDQYGSRIAFLGAISVEVITENRMLVLEGKCYAQDFPKNESVIKGTKVVVKPNQEFNQIPNCLIESWVHELNSNPPRVQWAHDGKKVQILCTGTKKVVSDDECEPMLVSKCELNEMAVCDSKGKETASGGNEVSNEVVCDDECEPMLVGNYEPNEKAVQWFVTAKARQLQLEAMK